MPDVTASDITDALDEFDELGRTDFLAKYGFGEARRYFLRRDGVDYDSKAIVGAAHTRRHGVPLTAAEFSGGDATVKRLLEGLGFEVVVRPPVSAAGSQVTEQNLGAWVLKCNPDVFDIYGLADAGEIVESWTVRQNFRSELMRYGQRVLLWVTGPADGDRPRGLWGAGWVVGPVEDMVEVQFNMSVLDKAPGA